MAETSLERYEREFNQAKARLMAAKARASVKMRKLDTRRKVILGGALIEQAAQNEAVAEVLNTLLTGLSRTQDKKTFECWTAPAQVSDLLPATPHADPDEKNST